jgi:hypothetical protein
VEVTERSATACTSDSTTARNDTGIQLGRCALRNAKNVQWHQTHRHGADTSSVPGASRPATANLVLPERSESVGLHCQKRTHRRSDIHVNRLPISWVGMYRGVLPLWGASSAQAVVTCRESLQVIKGVVAPELSADVYVSGRFLVNDGKIVSPAEFPAFENWYDRERPEYRVGTRVPRCGAYYPMGAETSYFEAQMLGFFVTGLKFTQHRAVVGDTSHSWIVDRGLGGVLHASQPGFDENNVEEQFLLDAHGRLKTYSSSWRASKGFTPSRCAYGPL